MIPSVSFVNNLPFPIEFIKHNDSGVSQLPLLVYSPSAEEKKSNVTREESWVEKQISWRRGELSSPVEQLDERSR